MQQREAGSGSWCLSRQLSPFICGHSWDEGTVRLLWYTDVSIRLGDLKSRVWIRNFEGLANNGVASAKD